VHPHQRRHELAVDLLADHQQPLLGALRPLLGRGDDVGAVVLPNGEKTARRSAELLAHDARLGERQQEFVAVGGRGDRVVVLLADLVLAAGRRVWERRPLRLPLALAGAVVRAACAQRRKTLANALAAGLGLSVGVTREAATSAGVDPGRRAETLNIREFAEVARRL